MKNKTESPINDLLASRWSPYAFDPKRDVGTDDLTSLFEGARWTMSSYNEQPWRFIVGVRSRDQRTWDQVFSVLVEGNQIWAKNAPVLVLGIAEHHFARNGEINKAALHDLGAASANITFEATARGLSVHQMIGIDPEKARETFGLSASLEPLTALAIGYAGASEAVDQAIAERDARPRERKSFQDIILRGTF